MEGTRMEQPGRRILWVDDEIDLLRPHILFLEQKGFEIGSATGGEEALGLLRDNRYDLVLLDEMMLGMDGLETLGEIKELDPSLPVVMVTKSEEEELMNDALGRRIDDFLIKPVKPTQVFLAIKRILDGRRILQDQLAQTYAAESSQLRMRIMSPLDWEEWTRVYLRLMNWDLELDRFRDPGLRQTHEDLEQSANQEFGRFVAEEYGRWVDADPGDRPMLSVDIFREFVAPRLKANEKVYFVVLDCMRLDHWMSLVPSLEPVFEIENHHYYSILPTATPFSRNALFSGLWPIRFTEIYPQTLGGPGRDETSKNRFERQLMDRQLERHGIRLSPAHKYVKIYEREEADNVRRQMSSMHDLPFVSMVYNFVDILSHSRSESEILQELAPDEPAFRSLVRSWFNHSALYHILVEMGRHGATVVLTTDHGAVVGRRAALIRGNRDTSTNLRYKFGSNLGCDEKETFLIRNPAAFKLPSDGASKQYAIAKEDYYFVYPTDFHRYERQYRGSLQHGGISLEEMILPCAVMTPRA
ncbi:MAG: response regulator [Candidatus Eisenbacteria bacterium]|nr:response regulator [Candidatus Eisenbacteria bacterium]